jgi:hypothetical protein
VGEILAITCRIYMNRGCKQMFRHCCFLLSLILHAVDIRAFRTSVVLPGGFPIVAPQVITEKPHFQSKMLIDTRPLINSSNGVWTSSLHPFESLNSSYTATNKVEDAVAGTVFRTPRLLQYN